METIPDRVSNGGPDSSDSAMDWRDHMADAEFEIHRASRIYDFDLRLEYRRRKEALEEAIAQLQNAVDKLPGA